MPYIKEEFRESVDKFNDMQGEGDLAYKLVGIYIDWLNQQTTKWRFRHFARLIGTVILSLLEFWQRIIVPYERMKRKENGDVF